VRSLVELQHEISRCVDLERLLGVLARDLAPHLPVKDRVSLALLEPDGAWLRVHRVLPAAERREGPAARVRVDGTPVGAVVRDGVGRVVSDVRTDPSVTFGQASHGGIRSTLSAPIRVGGRVVGALNAGSRSIGECDEEMLQRLVDIAALVGPAIVAAEQSFGAAAVAAAGVPARVTAAEQRPALDQPADLVGSSPSFRALLGAAWRAARSNADVLITGETGVGKTALARAVHGWSPRRAGPFVTVHLGDLTPTLIESELFGHERGSFTGASIARAGRFESARGGTIFLDEISETPLPIQSKLLRVIQDRQFERVGGGRTIEADVRIIAATSRDLRVAIQRGEFREDLFFRLNVVPLEVPPLRDRRDDLEALVAAILGRLDLGDGRPRRVAAAAWPRLRAHVWPGNIRELESVLRRAAILEESDELQLGELMPADQATAVPAAGDDWPTLDESERRYIERVLERLRGVIEGPHGAAKLLGVAPSTLRSRMQRLGMWTRPARGPKS
jgi:transcriptional regulator with GAF, ATPase, and Fis domain